MTNIAVFGQTEKRMFLYAYAKVLNSFGNVLLVTPNPNIKRFSEDLSEDGHIGNVTTLYSTDLPDDILVSIDETEDIDYIIWDCNENLLEDADLYIYVEGILENENDKKFLKVLDENEATVHYAKMYYGQSKKKGVQYIKVDLEVVTFIEITEARREFIALKNKELNKFLAKTLADYVKVPSSSIVRLLQKQGGYKR